MTEHIRAALNIAWFAARGQGGTSRNEDWIGTVDRADAQLRQTTRTMRITAAENLDMQMALSEIIGQCFNPRVTMRDDGVRIVEIYPDDLARWQKAMTGQGPE